MNTASRMESNGVPNRIQVSQDTAELLIEAGRSSWLVQRRDQIQAKGKGLMTTYFLQIKEGTVNTHTSYTDSSEGGDLMTPVSARSLRSSQHS